MHALLTAAYVLLFFALFYRGRLADKSGIPGSWLAGAFLIKFAAGIGLWAVYTYHYTYRDTSDALRYYDNGMVLYGYLKDDPALFFKLLFGIGLDAPDMQPVLDRFNGWNMAYNYGLPNDNPTIIRLNALIALFSLGHYHVHTAFMCMLSTWGLARIYRGLTAWVHGRRRVLFLALFAAPSVVFWGSGVLKESPVLALLGLLVGGLLVAEKHGWNGLRVMGVLLGTCGLVVLKMYVLLALLPGLFSWVVIRRWPGRSGLKALGVHALCAALALNASWIYPPGDALYILSKKQTDFYNVAEAMEAGSTVEIPPIQGLWSAVKAFPGALYNAYFRPDVTEMSSMFYAGLALENGVVMLLLLAAFALGGWSHAPPALRWWVWSFVVLYGWMVGLTVPILGAVVRYKVPALGFLLVGCFLGTWGRMVEGWLVRWIPFKEGTPPVPQE